MNESLTKNEKKKYNKSYLIYNKLSFYRYSYNKKFDSLSFKSKYSYLLSFYDDLKLSFYDDLKKIHWSLGLPLINCEIELDLRWARNCVISEVSRTFREVVPNVAQVEWDVATATTGATFQINNVKLYVAVVILSVNDSTRFLEKIKQGFK